MDPSLAITSLSDVQNAAYGSNQKTFDRTTKPGQTEYITKCSGAVETGVNSHRAPSKPYPGTGSLR